jgi:hypothetical protein
MKDPSGVGGSISIACIYPSKLNLRTETYTRLLSSRVVSITESIQPFTAVSNDAKVRALRVLPTAFSTHEHYESIIESYIG